MYGKSLIDATKHPLDSVLLRRYFPYIENLCCNDYNGYVLAVHVEILSTPKYMASV